MMRRSNVTIQSGGTRVLAVSGSQEALLIWRHRFITGTWGWEVPTGEVEDGESPAEAAAREFTEEPAGGPGRCGT
jgi:8-oxo-dGTP pyrophosphatase MutT (NUDIX family)